MQVISIGKYISIFKKPMYNVNKNLNFGPIMKEDFFAKSRNGHLLRDTFNKETNTLDIYSNGLYPANVLSNLAHKPFVFEDIECASIEGFLQSLKIKDPVLQKEVCALYGGSAKKISKKHIDWLTTQILYWKGKAYKRNSEEYYNLLKRAYQACYEQNETFKNALDSTKGKHLSHAAGKNSIETTVITKDEFTNILTYIRDRLA